MKGQLIKAFNRNELMDIMYLSKDGKITKRRIKITKILDDKFMTYCFTKHSLSTFIIDNILAYLPVIHRGREVV